MALIIFAISGSGDGFRVARGQGKVSGKDIFSMSVKSQWIWICFDAVYPGRVVHGPKPLTKSVVIWLLASIAVFLSTKPKKSESSLWYREPFDNMQKLKYNGTDTSH